MIEPVSWQHVVSNRTDVCSPRCLPLRHLFEEVCDQIIHHCTLAICGKPASARDIQKHVGIWIANPGVKIVCECHQQILKVKKLCLSNQFSPEVNRSQPSSLLKFWRCKSNAALNHTVYFPASDWRLSPERFKLVQPSHVHTGAVQP